MLSGQYWTFEGTYKPSRFTATALRGGVIVCFFLLLGFSEAHSQPKESPIQTFGYFQIAFRHDESNKREEQSNSYSVQQLNLIFQKNFSRQWLAFINFELLNNFSSSRRWGSLDMDEAWISYRTNRQMTLKAGLHVPVFNNLNEIKNRTPLLPYIIRPLIYEESFAEILNIEEFVPNRAFLQASGTLSFGKTRLDYAGYVGNSPNINSQFDNEREGGSQQTGVDTTTTILIGGRVGLRIRDLKLGVSGTRESVNFFRTLTVSQNGETPFLGGIPPERFNGVIRTRFGADLSFHFNKFSFESELIAVGHSVDTPQEFRDLPSGSEFRINLDKLFYYGTLGYEAGEHLFIYGSYWYTGQSFSLQVQDQSVGDELDIDVYTVGARYSMFQDEDGFDRIALKAQYAYVPIHSRVELDAVEDLQEIHFFSLAISVLF